MKKTRLCDVKWDSGNKPEIDNTYFVYNCGNDGLYHLALAAEVTCSAQLFCLCLFECISVPVYSLASGG